MSAFNKRKFEDEEKQGDYESAISMVQSVFPDTSEDDIKEAFERCSRKAEVFTHNMLIYRYSYHQLEILFC